MEKKIKILIITGACLLVLGVGTGITIHAVNQNTTNTSVNTDDSNSEEVTGSSEADKKENTTTVANNKDTTNISENTTKKTDSSSNQVATDSKGTTSTNTTTGKSTGTSNTQTTTATGNTPSSTTEGKKNTAVITTETTEHTHNWVAVYKTVHHDATYKTETYVIQDAWDEEIKEGFYVCNQCGKSFRILDWTMPGGGTDAQSQAYINFITHILTCQDIGSSYHSESRVVNVVHHDAEYGTRQVIDKPAWDEQVIDYYKCSCGATKK